MTDCALILCYNPLLYAVTASVPSLTRAQSPMLSPSLISPAIASRTQGVTVQDILTEILPPPDYVRRAEETVPTLITHCEKWCNDEGVTMTPYGCCIAGLVSTEERCACRTVADAEL